MEDPRTDETTHDEPRLAELQRHDDADDEGRLRALEDLHRTLEDELERPETDESSGP
jgi:hypothetical protein